MLAGIPGNSKAADNCSTPIPQIMDGALFEWLLLCLFIVRLIQIFLILFFYKQSFLGQ